MSAATTDRLTYSDSEERQLLFCVAEVCRARIEAELRACDKLYGTFAEAHIVQRITSDG